VELEATLSKKDALERLAERVRAAEATAGVALRDTPLEELEQRCLGHALGTNANGWQNPYPPTDARHLLLEYQFANFRDRSRFKIGLMGRQTGKDFTSEGEAVEDCQRRPKTEWMVAAPSERQALDSLEKGREWAGGFDLQVADYQETREGSSQTLLKSAEITFANGSRIRAVPGKPDTVRGRSANILLTEFDFFEQPAATWRAILPSITNPLRGGEKKVRLVSTPNGAGGAMQKIWTKDDSEKMKWSRHFVTIFHAVLMGLPVDIAQLREAFDDPDGFAQEFLCQFLDGSNVLLPYDLIQLAESFDATEVWDLTMPVAKGAPIFVGVDFGRTNDPTVCWTVQRVGGLLWTREVLVLKNVSSPDQEEILRSRIAACTRCCFDYTGPGIGLGDYLVKKHKRWDPEKHEFGKVELCTFTAGLKRLIFPRLRRAFEAPTLLRIPYSVAIREDLHQMQQQITNGEYNYWSPRTRLGHSDRATALALCRRAAEGEQNAAWGIPTGTRARVMRERREAMWIA
jgi:phage FluMu gp28-like protein